MPYFLKHSLISEKNFYNRCALLSNRKIRCNKNEKKIIAAAFLDLSKAFDPISHEPKIQKPSIHGFSIPARNLITSYFLNRT